MAERKKLATEGNCKSQKLFAGKPMKDDKIT